MIKYVYVANGNMTVDLNRGICQIEYNLLNLPQTVRYLDGSHIEYSYDSKGGKMRIGYYINPRQLLLPQPNAGTAVGYAGSLPLIHSWTAYCDDIIYRDGSLSMMLVEGGYVTFGDSVPRYHFYVKDYLGNNRVVVDETGTVEEVNHYTPFGALMADSSAPSVQPYKYNGKKLDTDNALNWYYYGARYYDAALGRWLCMDPLAEKYYDVSPYAYCGNSPVNAVDINGDSITMDAASIMAVYNGLQEGHQLSMKFRNGVLDPNSFGNEIENTNDTFIKDLYEIAIHPYMVELHVTQDNTFLMKGKVYHEVWKKPEDYNVMNEKEPMRSQLITNGYPPGKTIIGNLGQTLYPRNSDELKRSLDNSVTININGLATLNQQSCGLAHEFGHVILYLRQLPHSHKGNSNFIYGREWNVMKRFGYDYLESPSGFIFH